MAVAQDVDAGAFEFFFERIETVGFVAHVDTTISVSAKRFGRLLSLYVFKWDLL